MKTKIIFALMILLSSLTVFAQDEQTRVIDNASLLTPAQKILLEQRISDIAKKYNFDLVILTEADIGSAAPGEYADSFYDKGGYGRGANKDGCILIQVTNGRDFLFSSSGRGAKILNDTAAGKLESGIVKHLKDDQPYEAYYSFISNWEQFLELEAKGRSYNIFHQYNAAMVIAAWVFAFALAGIIIGTWKKKMNTALAQTQADAYTVPGSLNYKLKTDRFLFSTVTKTKREKSSSGSSSGGSGNRGRGGKY